MRVSCGVYAGVLLVIDVVSVATGSIVMYWSDRGTFCIWTPRKTDTDIFANSQVKFKVYYIIICTHKVLLELCLSWS